MSRSDSPQWLPEFCSLPTLFAVMVVAELVALVVCLGPNPGAEPLLPRLGVLTVYVQWLALVNAALLCSLRKPLEKLGLTRVKDLAYHLPDRFVQRRTVAHLDEADVGEQIVVALTVSDQRSSAGRGPFRVLTQDARGVHIVEQLTAEFEVQLVSKPFYPFQNRLFLMFQIAFIIKACLHAPDSRVDI